MELTGGRSEQSGGGDITNRRGIKDAFVRGSEERERDVGRGGG
jgi:hypothetical protein